MLYDCLIKTQHSAERCKSKYRVWYLPGAGWLTEIIEYTTIWCRRKPRLMAALTWGFVNGSYLNSANCWNGRNSNVKRNLLTKISSRKLHTSSNQQERLNKLIQDENYKFWLGGFIEGEGSLVVSLVKNTKVLHGLALQPEFNVVQHESGIAILHSFKSLFEDKGSVHKKSGSEDVWVYSLKGTQNLKNSVLPFFEKYVITYSSKYKGEVFDKFSIIINKLYDNRNKTFSKYEIIHLIELVYSYNPDTKGKSRKRTLQETIDIVNLKHE